MALAVAAAGIALVVLVGAGRLLVEGAAPDPATPEALGAAWGAFLAGLLGWGVALAALGVALTAAATLPVCRVAIDEQLRALAGLFTRTPEGHWAAIARGVALVLAGWALATRPLAVVELVVPIAGLYLVFAGLAELLHESGLRPAGAPRSRGAARLAWRVRAFSAPSATALLVLGAGGALVALFAAFSFGVFGGDGRGGPIPPEEIHACNGHASLCDRPLSEAAFAGSHNAMAASSEPGWLFASHRAGIATQLDHGVRALLVDTHYGAASGGLVRTALIQEFDAAGAAAELGEDAVAALERSLARLDPTDGGDERHVYLCHVLCEFGATDFVAALRAVRAFLDHHPAEVLILFVEDHVSAADAVAALEEGGLAALAYAHRPGAPWPTLRELIARNERVLVMAEHSGFPADAAAPNWYHAGFEPTQETPFDFASAEESSSAPNRGRADGPLFQLNHWIATYPPRVEDAERVNALDVLLARAEACRAARGQIPNVVAVDFHGTGELLRLVDILNRVAPAAPA